MARVEYKVVTFQVYAKPTDWQHTKVPRQVGTKYEYVEVLKATEWSDYLSDVDELKKDMEKSLNELATQGWHVVSVETVLRGSVVGTNLNNPAFSLTNAFIVVLEREVVES